MLRLENLAASYGPAQVLFDISLTVGDGEVVTLIGRNGMGKTTTIFALMGLVPPQGGSATFDGLSLIGLPPYRIAQAGIGLVPEGRQISPTLDRRGKSHRHRRRTLRQGAMDARARLQVLSLARRAPQQHGQRAVRRRAADAGDRPRADDQPEDL